MSLSTGAHAHKPVESHHSTQIKRGVVRCLHDRARGIINTQDNIQKAVDNLVIEYLDRTVAL